MIRCVCAIVLAVFLTSETFALAPEAFLPLGAQTPSERSLADPQDNDQRQLELQGLQAEPQDNPGEQPPVWNEFIGLLENPKDQLDTLWIVFSKLKTERDTQPYPANALAEILRVFREHREDWKLEFKYAVLKEFYRLQIDDDQEVLDFFEAEQDALDDGAKDNLWGLNYLYLLHRLRFLHMPAEPEGLNRRQRMRRYLQKKTHLKGLVPRSVYGHFSQIDRRVQAVIDSDNLEPGLLNDLTTYLQENRAEDWKVDFAGVEAIEQVIKKFAAEPEARETLLQLIRGNDQFRGLHGYLRMRSYGHTIREKWPNVGLERDYNRRVRQKALHALYGLVEQDIFIEPLKEYLQEQNDWIDQRSDLQTIGEQVHNHWLRLDFPEYFDPQLDAQKQFDSWEISAGQMEAVLRTYKQHATNLKTNASQLKNTLKDAHNDKAVQKIWADIMPSIQWFRENEFVIFKMLKERILEDDSAIKVLEESFTLLLEVLKTSVAQEDFYLNSFIAEIARSTLNMMFSYYALNLQKQKKKRVKMEDKQAWLDSLNEILALKKGLKEDDVAKNSLHYELHLMRKGVDVLPDNSEEGKKILKGLFNGIVASIGSRSIDKGLLDALSNGAMYLLKKGWQGSEKKVYEFVYNIEKFKWTLMGNMEFIGSYDGDTDLSPQEYMAREIYKVYGLIRELIEHRDFWEVRYAWVKALGDLAFYRPVVYEKSQVSMFADDQIWQRAQDKNWIIALGEQHFALSRYLLDPQTQDRNLQNALEQLNQNPKVSNIREIAVLGQESATGQIALNGVSHFLNDGLGAAKNWKEQGRRLFSQMETVRKKMMTQGLRLDEMIRLIGNQAWDAFYKEMEEYFKGLGQQFTQEMFEQIWKLHQESLDNVDQLLQRGETFAGQLHENLESSKKSIEALQDQMSDFQGKVSTLDDSFESLSAHVSQLLDFAQKITDFDLSEVLKYFRLETETFLNDFADKMQTVLLEQFGHAQSETLEAWRDLKSFVQDEFAGELDAAQIDGLLERMKAIHSRADQAYQWFKKTKIWLEAQVEKHQTHIKRYEQYVGKIPLLKFEDKQKLVAVLKQLEELAVRFQSDYEKIEPQLDVFVKDSRQFFKKSPEEQKQSLSAFAKDLAAKLSDEATGELEKLLADIRGYAQGQLELLNQRVKREISDLLDTMEKSLNQSSAMSKAQYVLKGFQEYLDQTIWKIMLAQAKAHSLKDHAKSSIDEGIKLTNWLLSELLVLQELAQKELLEIQGLLAQAKADNPDIGKEELRAKLNQFPEKWQRAMKDLGEQSGRELTDKMAFISSELPRQFLEVFEQLSHISSNFRNQLNSAVKGVEDLTEEGREAIEQWTNSFEQTIDQVKGKVLDSIVSEATSFMKSDFMLDVQETWKDFKETKVFSLVSDDAVLDYFWRDNSWRVRGRVIEVLLSVYSQLTDKDIVFKQNIESLIANHKVKEVRPEIIRLMKEPVHVQVVVQSLKKSWDREKDQIKSHMYDAQNALEDIQGDLEKTQKELDQVTKNDPQKAILISKQKQLYKDYKAQKAKLKIQLNNLQELDEDENLPTITITYLNDIRDSLKAMDRKLDQIISKLDHMEGMIESLTSVPMHDVLKRQREAFLRQMPPEVFIEFNVQVQQSSVGSGDDHLEEDEKVQSDDNAEIQGTQPSKSACDTVIEDFICSQNDMPCLLLKGRNGFGKTVLLDQVARSLYEQSLFTYSVFAEKITQKNVLDEQKIRVLWDGLLSKGHLQLNEQDQASLVFKNLSLSKTLKETFPYESEEVRMNIAQALRQVFQENPWGHIVVRGELSENKQNFADELWMGPGGRLMQDQAACIEKINDLMIKQDNLFFLTFIIEGYSSLPFSVRQGNILSAYHLNRWRGSKFIITARPGSLSSKGYTRDFVFEDPEVHGVKKVMEMEIQPLAPKQIKSYLNKKDHKDIWKFLNHNRDLLGIVDSPRMLKDVLDIFPALSREQLSLSQINRYRFFELFVKERFKDYEEKKRAEFLVNKEDLYIYAQKIAIAMFEQRTERMPLIQPSVFHRDDYYDDDNVYDPKAERWRELSPFVRDELKSLFDGLPMQSLGGEAHFYSKYLLDYFIARHFIKMFKHFIADIRLEDLRGELDSYLATDRSLSFRRYLKNKKDRIEQGNGNERVRKRIENLLKFYEQMKDRYFVINRLLFKSDSEVLKMISEGLARHEERYQVVLMMLELSRVGRENFPEYHPDDRGDGEDGQEEGDGDVESWEGLEDDYEYRPRYLYSAANALAILAESPQGLRERELTARDLAYADLSFQSLNGSSLDGSNLDFGNLTGAYGRDVGLSLSHTKDLHLGMPVRLSTESDSAIVNLRFKDNGFSGSNAQSQVFFWDRTLHRRSGSMDDHQGDLGRVPERPNNYGLRLAGGQNPDSGAVSLRQQSDAIKFRLDIRRNHKPNYTLNVPMKGLMAYDFSEDQNDLALLSSGKIVLLQNIWNAEGDSFKENVWSSHYPAESVSGGRHGFTAVAVSSETAVATSEKHRYVIAGDDRGQVYIWDVLDPYSLKILNLSEHQISSLTVHPDDGRVLAGDVKGFVHMFNLKDVFLGHMSTLRERQSIVSPKGDCWVHFERNIPNSKLTVNNFGADSARPYDLSFPHPIEQVGFSLDGSALYVVYSYRGILPGLSRRVARLDFSRKDSKTYPSWKMPKKLLGQAINEFFVSPDHKRMTFKLDGGRLWRMKLPEQGTLEGVLAWSGFFDLKNSLSEERRFFVHSPQGQYRFYYQNARNQSQVTIKNYQLPKTLIEQTLPMELEQIVFAEKKANYAFIGRHSQDEGNVRRLVFASHPLGHFLSRSEPSWGKYKNNKSGWFFVDDQYQLVFFEQSAEQVTRLGIHLPNSESYLMRQAGTKLYVLSNGQLFVIDLSPQNPTLTELQLTMPFGEQRITDFDVDVKKQELALVYNNMHIVWYDMAKKDLIDDVHELAQGPLSVRFHGSQLVAYEGQNFFTSELALKKVLKVWDRSQKELRLAMLWRPLDALDISPKDNHEWDLTHFSPENQNILTRLMDAHRHKKALIESAA